MPYAVLGVGLWFALANALLWSTEVLAGRGRLMLATVGALVVGKLAGILLGARAAVRLGIANKPDACGWRQVAGAGALAGIGFTMSLFIAGEALAETSRERPISLRDLSGESSSRARPAENAKVVKDARDRRESRYGCALAGGRALSRP